MQYGFTINSFRFFSKKFIQYSICITLCITTSIANSQSISPEKNITSTKTASNPLDKTAPVEQQLSASTQGITNTDTTSNPKSSTTDPKDQLIKTSLSLLFVLILLLGLLWFMKRMGFGTGRRMSGFYRVLATSALGPKDKLVLIEIGDTWLLLGITSNSINTLHSMPAGSLDLNTDHKNTAEQFAKLLNRFNVNGKQTPDSKTFNKENNPLSQKEQT